MAETTTRILSLLGLLQSHRQWTGQQLATRLGVTERTLRRDIEHLREMGYRVDAARGVAGGYRLEAGSQLPPLLFTRDEAVTIAIGLRAAALSGLVDGELTTQSALAKFEQLLPTGARARVNALASHLQSQATRTTAVSQELLGSLALACRDLESIRFHYVAADGAPSDRVVEPHALVAAARHWFLVCWDVQRAQWRTFRVDRMSRFFGTRLRFDPRDLPGGDAAAFLASAVAALHGRYRMEVDVHLSLEEMRRTFGEWAKDAVALRDEWCTWTVETMSRAELLGTLGWIPRGVDYVVRADDDLVEYAREAAGRLAAAVR